MAGRSFWAAYARRANRELGPVGRWFAQKGAEGMGAVVAQPVVRVAKAYLGLWDRVRDGIFGGGAAEAQEATQYRHLRGEAVYDENGNMTDFIVREETIITCPGDSACGFPHLNDRPDVNITYETEGQ